MSNQPQNMDEFTFKSAFDYEFANDLAKYGQNALAVFALSLELMLDDIENFTADAITEDSRDKKADIFYLDLNEKRAIIAQNYVSKTWGKSNAPEQKASDLNTAMTWILSASEDDIPSALKPKSIDMRRALRDGDIDKIDIFYIHNCYESENVSDQMKGVKANTRNVLSAILVGSEIPEVTAIELGLNRIEELYKGRQSEILVEDWLEVPASKVVEEGSAGWKAILTSVPGDWIYQLYHQHQTRLFSANYRDYLGSPRRKGNINRQITDSATTEPHNFWVYNNGITALTHELELEPTIRIRGISIINGAQTTGALSEAAPTPDIRVLIRIVECSQKDLIHNIIQYNNTQNDIKPADRRSNDNIQKRLKEQFADYGINYVHRRGDTRIARTDITGTAVAAALCAFHGDLQTAHRNAPEIFVSDALYNRVFPITISAEHVFLVRSLAIAIDSLKDELKDKVSDGNATKQELRQYDALKYAASKPFVIFLVGDLAEEITGKAVSDLFEWKCNKGIISSVNRSMSKAWTVALRAILPQIAHVVEEQGKDAFYEVPRSGDASKKVAKKLKANIASLTVQLESQFDEIRNRTNV